MLPSPVEYIPPNRTRKRTFKCVSRANSFTLNVPRNCYVKSELERHLQRNVHYHLGSGDSSNPYVFLVERKDGTFYQLYCSEVDRG